MAFTKAVKTSAKLRLALSGPAGAGKTYTALKLATELADGKPIAVIDTERGSAAKYADEFEFDVMELEPPYHPSRYMDAIRDAEAGGYAVLVIDSLTHAWNGQGGLLELHEQVVKRQSVKNSYTAWAEVTPIQNRLIDSITGSKLHIIATMRSKTEYVQEQGNNGKTSIRKVGAASIQREGMEYEFDIVGDMNQDHELIVTKTRCPALTDAIIAKPGKQVADTLRTWLSGAPAPTRPMPAADDARKVVTPQIVKDRARIQAEPTPDTSITYTVEVSETATDADGLIQISLVDQIKRLKDELGIVGPQWERMKKVARSQDELLAKLQELADAKADGFPLDGPARKAAQG